MERKSNRLAGEQSPYLLQHATNPVDWYPWGPEAFEAAQRSDRPIFLSIGYSSCHWCHMMERESFEDQEVADLMNDTFVCIKVDREERPEVDSLYMKVCQMMTGGGGWPLTIIMTPDRVPFWAGTYLPRRSRQGMPGLLDLVPAIAKAWKDGRSEIREVTVKVLEMLDSFERDPEEGDVSELVGMTFQHLTEDYEPKYGGFDAERKFPSPHKLLFLMRYWRERKDQKALDMAIKTLDSIVRGGLRDHVGGGFHRYSTDPRWHLPHFEKMLYDQALLLMALSEGFAITGRAEYRQAAEELVDYVAERLTSPEGAFYSSEDADAAGEEGSYYVWSMQELASTLSPEDLSTFKELYDLWDSGNFRDEASRTRSGKNVLHRTAGMEEFAEKKGMGLEELGEWDARVRASLKKAREKRPEPALDDKVLTDWNGLMVAALCLADRHLGMGKALPMARRALKFLEEGMVSGGELHHSFRQGHLGPLSLMDDHACLSWANLEMYFQTLEERFLERSLGLMEEAMRLYLDREDGGFYLSREDPDLLIRMKDLYDGAAPSGNSVAYYVLSQLGALFVDQRTVDAMDGCERHFMKELKLTPSAFAMFVNGILMKYEHRTLEVFGDAEARFPGYHPHLLVIRAEHMEAGIEAKVPAYRLCIKGACLPATDDRTEVEKML
ncbi:MAG: thioredoxin domain-containing protein [Euryarchaeota archaeon]|nr:thioredoxin domain-containing protein [Euryarchaeota archaeon]